MMLIYTLKASPLPPAPLATSWLLICRLQGLAGIQELISRIEINGQQRRVYNQFTIYLIIGLCWFLTPFRVPRWPFWIHLEVLGHYFGTMLQSSGSPMHTEGPRKVPSWIFNDCWWIWGPPLDTSLDHFLIFSVIWGIKKHVWCAGMIFNDFWMKIVLIYDVSTYQKYCK